jgi:hypothetical protein
MRASFFKKIGIWPPSGEYKLAFSNLKILKNQNRAVVRIPQQNSASELSTNSHEPLQHKVETLKRYQGGDEQTMPRGVATARGGVWTAVQVGSVLRRAALR